MLSNRELNDIRKLNFYEKVDPATWAENQSIEQVKVWGDYPEVLPLCTIVIKTYKRPLQLRRAIWSALNQVGYDDYCIIVADNEGADLSIKTDTQGVIEEIENRKVIYYRYTRSTGPECSRYNAAANLVKTKYMTFLDDDDVLSSSFMRVMMKTILSHKGIDALMCSYKNLYENNDDTMDDEIVGKDFFCRKIDFIETVWSLRNCTRGVIYDTEKYRNIGGSLEANLGCGDVIFCSRFSYYYDQYWLDAQLYGVYIHSGQLSQTYPDEYYRSFFSSYYWRKDGLKRYFGIKWFFFEGIVQKRLFDGITGLAESHYSIGLSEVKLAELIGIVAWSNKKPFERKLYNTLSKIWKKYLKYVGIYRKIQGFTIEV